MANESFANTLVVEVEDVPLAADVATMLTYAYVDDSRNLPDLFVLRFRDPQHVVLDKAKFVIGAKVALKVQTAEPTGPQLLLAGEVTALEVELDPSGSVTEVRGLDVAHRLFRGRRVAAYPNMTVPDIVRKVAQRAGVKTGTLDPVPGVSGTAHTQLSQDNVSDWEFLSRLADLVGAQLAVADGKLDFRLPAAPKGAPDPRAKAHTDPLVLEAGRNLVSLRACVSAAEQVPSVEARGWDFERKQEVSATAVPTTAGAEVAGLDPVELGRKFKSPPYVAADASWRTPGSVRATAAALAAQLGGACVELDGVAKGNPKLRAGASVALGGVGEQFAGKYVLTSTRHLFSDHGYETAFIVSGRQERSLFGLVQAGGADTRGDRGLVPGIVSDVRDPLELGRVRLTYPWLAKDFTSGWARLVAPGAGKGRGALFLPEVGDEVLVGFTGGDMDSPYVLGGLYNGKDTLPKLSAAPVDGGSGEIAARALVSRTGHRLELVENDGVLLATGDGKLSVKLDKKSGRVTVTGARGLVLDAGTGKVEIKGTGVSVDGGSGPVEIKGQKVSAQGTAEAELKATGQVTVSGGIVKIN
ncbi:VgrG-related protein [Longispora sp. NPDC051575]|uniref:VgrG-related protein n=1 Tax=Longispora sp. NPDC051575 TaxID=3154943 RepID=UPI00343342D0